MCWLDKFKPWIHLIDLIKRLFGKKEKKKSMFDKPKKNISRNKGKVKKDKKEIK
jgi:hypothetical protein